MKNKLKQELSRELDGVRVSGDLKQRIIEEARESRVPSRRKSFSLKPLAAAAAVMVTVALTAGVIALRAEKPDLNATTLSVAKVKTTQELVWVRLPEGLYHAASDCPEAEDPVSMQLDTARASGMKGCSACIESDSAIGENLVWITGFGEYYHAQKDCSGMEGAVGVLEIEAVTLGRSECPVCLNGLAATLEPESTAVQWAEPTPAATVEPTPTPMPTVMPTAAPEVYDSDGASAAVGENPVEEMVVWMTDGGLYYHSWEHCSGMKGAGQRSESEAIQSGKQACAVCLPETTAEVCDGEAAVSTGNDEVWVGKDNSYHANEFCPDLVTDDDGYTIVAESNAIQWGKAPCGRCITEMGDDVFDNALTVEAACVWTTDGSEYYHMDEHCSGMEGAHGCSVIEALCAEKLPCPVCAKQVGSVWATVGGQYFHLSKDCSGMSDPEEMTWDAAVAQGKILCEVCHAELIEAVKNHTAHDHSEEHH